MKNIPEDWKSQARDKQKRYSVLLKKANTRKIISQLDTWHEEAFEKINCLDCAGCCKNHSPRFNQRDITRIAKHLRIKEGELVSQYLYLDNENDYVLKSSPCHFLNDDNTCKIYEVRPLDCQRYPYTNEDVLVKRVRITQANSKVCPAVFLVLEKIENALGQ